MDWRPCIILLQTFQECSSILFYSRITVCSHTAICLSSRITISLPHCLRLQQSNQHINHHHSLNISSTKHHFQFSPGSYDLMTGCPLEWKCFVPCLLIDWSQHPTWPQLKHRRRCTHVDPICKHSSQPSGVLALTFLIT